MNCHLRYDKERTKQERKKKKKKTAAKYAANGVEVKQLDE